MILCHELVRAIFKHFSDSSFLEHTVPAACHCRRAFPRSCRAGIAQPRARSLGQAPCAPQVPSASRPRAVPTGRAHQMARVSSPFSVPREQLSKPPPLPLESARVLLLAGPRGSGRHTEQGHRCVTSGGPRGRQGDAATLSAALVRAQVSGRRALPPRGHRAGAVTAQVPSPRRCGRHGWKLDSACRGEAAQQGEPG